MKSSRYLKSLILSAAVIPAAASAFIFSDPAVLPEPGPYPEASATIASRLNAASRMSQTKNFRGVIDELRAFITTSELPLTPTESRQFISLLGRAYYETSDPRALSLLQDYLNEWPAGREATEIKLLQADFYFFSHDWSEALQHYQALDTSILNSADRNLYTYRCALCMIKCGFFSEARPLLKLLEKSNEYATPVLYYASYIYYVEGEDARAMKGFTEVASKIDKSSSELVPDYYIAQLLFRKGEWRECANKAARLLRTNINSELAVATRRIYGMSEYEEGYLAKAAPLLQLYVKEAGDSASHDALYALGVCYYNEDELTKAEDCFSRIAADQDALGQGAALYLGQIAARRDEASVAAMNFERAYRINYDNNVAETALYNYVAARARGGNVPFDSNVEMLEEFIKNYPTSEYSAIIERHLSTLYYNNGDYENALRIVNKIKRPSKADTELHQMILYAGGTSALSSGNPEQAVKLLEQGVAISTGKEELRAQSRLWLADALYDLHRYAEAEKEYDAALKSGLLADNTLHARYNLGYAQLMQNKFDAASESFNKMLSSSVDIPNDMNRDARLRLADCKYYAGDYANAKNDFSTLRTNGYGADYATYRYAQILGLDGNLKEKIAELKKMEKNYSDSRWMSNALAELADTYSVSGNSKDAAATYSRMLNKYPHDSNAPRAQLGMAQSLMQTGNAEKGVEAYKDVLRNWPSSPEARLADTTLREYYAETDALPEYASFLKSFPGFSLNASQMEELAYNAAERHYLENNVSAQPLKKYLSDYPEGSHAAEAWSLLATHYSEHNDRQNALAAYRELEKRGGAEYATEAYTGIMRTADNTAVREEYARKLRDSGGAPADALEEADFYIAEAQLNSKDANARKEAENKLKDLALNPFSESGARSAVTLGEYLINKNRPQEALGLMEEFTSSGTRREYWLARGFLVMVDAYNALGDNYMANEYLRSLKRNYPGNDVDIRNGIERRLK